MAIKHILTIESVDGSVSRRMLSSIYGANEFKDYKVEHCFFLKKFQRVVNQDELFHILSNKIFEFKADAVLIHAGQYFLDSKDAFLRAIPRLKILYPKTLFGIQNRPNLDKELLSIFDDNEDIKNLERIFFRINR